MPSDATILVVDDEPDLHLLIRQAFRKETEWDFVSAGNGMEALDQLRRRPEIDVVLTDLNMPRMDGFGLLDGVRQMEWPLRVVVVSAYGDTGNIRAAMNRGAYDFVTKPINRKDLEATIRKTLEEVRVQRQAWADQQRLATVEQELAVTQRVQELKARFFADLSHEFRTPLTLILGPLQDALHASTALHEEDIRVMHRYALRLRRLIDQLLDLSKLEAGRMMLHTARRDVLGFLRELVQSFVPSAERRRLTLRFTPPDDEDEILLYFDPDKLEQIIANVLTNALKFTRPGGIVRVSVRTVPDAVEIAVRDSGTGIPDEALPHLFERFYQVGRGDGGDTGTGIGLALAKELVELHGGSIAVESEEGFGTTFTVRLRRGTDHLGPDEVADASPAGAWTFEGEQHVDEPEAGETEEPVPSSAPSVLIAEDNADVRAYLGRHLGSRYRVLEAADGIEALDLARAEAPALIVSDVMMPRMDGVELCRAIKTDEALRSIPVILVTARADDEEVAEGLETGADDYLTKPFNARELLLRAENLIEIRRTLRERFSDEVMLKPIDVPVPSADAAFLERVKTFTEENMGDRNFDVASVADAVGLSPRQLQRRLRDITGLSPSGFVRSLRLQRAAQLLVRSAGNISEVAYSVGYEDAKHFSRRFRQVYGVLPSAYAEGARAE